MTAAHGTDWPLRLACEDDVPALGTLIDLSVRTLLTRHYTGAQLDAALGPVFGVDRQLIRDGTYFVAEHEGRLVACGGWSRRKSVYGGDRERVMGDAELDPTMDAARIRAFFVHPAWERRGLGRSLLAASERAIRTAGFHGAELVATLAGEPLYHRFGFRVVERYEASLSGGLTLPVVRMAKEWTPGAAAMDRINRLC